MDREKNNRWHLSKDIPISMLAYLVVQTILFTWFLSALNSKLNTTAEENTSSKLIAYTKEDARHEREFMEQKFLLLANRDEETMRRMSLLEGSVNELKAKQQR